MPTIRAPSASRSGRPLELRVGPGKGVHLLEPQGFPAAYDRPVLGPARLRRSCLRLPGSVEEFPFGEGVSVFKVAGKIFALSPLRSRPLTVSLKCEPEIAEQLRAAHHAVRPGYHLNKRHWNTVEIDGSLEDRSILDMIEDSYDLVVDGLPKRVQAELGWPPAHREPS
jgi:predicted DNA-binding protein (MmcQ/YjbR family)